MVIQNLFNKISYIVDENGQKRKKYGTAIILIINSKKFDYFFSFDENFYDKLFENSKFITDG